MAACLTRTLNLIVLMAAVVGTGFSLSGCNQKLELQVDDLTKKVASMEAQVTQLQGEIAAFKQVAADVANIKAAAAQAEAANTTEAAKKEEAASEQKVEEEHSHSSHSKEKSKSGGSDEHKSSKGHKKSKKKPHQD